ncbi:MAG: TatD family hydrolase [Methylophilales bacterium]|nr:TatD family hydrolase [Methylophilales bacterium]
MNRLVDTHCHLDAPEFDADRDEVAAAAKAAGVAGIVVPAVEKANFATVLQLCECHSHCVAALGIHPLYINRAQPEDLKVLRELLNTETVVAVGEIGLDYFVADQDLARQEWFFVEQLKLAQEFNLPVILHVRRAVDAILKNLRKIKVVGGIAHAFNGSRQQADAFIKLGFKLGFGGAMTFERALKIRELATTLPLESIVLETDAPDIAPVWLNKQRNSPTQLPKIAEVLAQLRQETLDAIFEITTGNALAVLPRLKMAV